jgi:hypothetical protein
VPHLRITFGTLLLAAAVACGGCTSSIIAPTAKVTSITLADQSAQGARVQVTVELKNENTVPLPLVRCDYTVSLAGVGSFTFSENPNKAIPARRTDINAGPATQVVTLIAAFATAGEVKGRDCRVDGSITYETPGEIRKIMTETSLPLPAMPFSGGGRLE